MTVAAVVLAVAGCAKEIEGELKAPEQPEDEAGTMVIGAELSDSPDADDVTKTLISDNGNKTYSVFWAKGDQILVNGETSTNIDIDPDNKKSASFTLPVVDAPYCAVYPAGLYVKDSYKTVKEDSTVIEITIPSKIVVASGRELQVFHDNYCKGLNSERIMDSTMVGIDSNKRFGHITPNDSTTDRICTVVVNPFIEHTGVGGSAQDLNKNQISKSFDLKIVSSNAGLGTTRNVMLFGDSITAYGYYPQELKNLFENDPMNVNFLGTLGMHGQEGNLHEGRGGWSAWDYLSKQNYLDYTNAFWNPSTNQFDFTYYMNNNSFSSIDDFVILLGINDLNMSLNFSTINHYNTIIDSVRSYNPNCNILIGLCTLPCQMEYGNLSSAQKEKNRRLTLWKDIIKEFDNRENERIFIVPVGLSLDSIHDFPKSTKPLSARNSDVIVEYPTDTTHPKPCGFYKIADMVYSYIKYMATLN